MDGISCGFVYAFIVYKVKKELEAVPLVGYTARAFEAISVILERDWRYLKNYTCDGDYEEDKDE